MQGVKQINQQVCVAPYLLLLWGDQERGPSQAFPSGRVAGGDRLVWPEEGFKEVGVLWGAQGALSACCVHVVLEGPDHTDNFLFSPSFVIASCTGELSKTKCLCFMSVFKGILFFQFEMQSSQENPLVHSPHTAAEEPQVPAACQHA